MHLSFLNEKGEFLSAEDGMKVLWILLKKMILILSTVDSSGSLDYDETWGAKHIDLVLELKPCLM